MSKSIYDLKLHETLWEMDSGVNIQRVAGGWLYSSFDENEQTIYNSVFVPYNNEFQKEANAK